MAADIEKGKYKRLNPTTNDGILVVAGRTEKWMEATWNNQYFILLAKGHRLSYLIALSSHQSSGHLGVSSTIAVIRSKYWIIGIRRIVSSIVSKCVKCKIKFKRLESQRMCPLPIERIKPSPAFSNVAIDYFGPFAIKGEVQRESAEKVMPYLLHVMFPELSMSIWRQTIQRHHYYLHYVDFQASEDGQVISPVILDHS